MDNAVSDETLILNHGPIPFHQDMHIRDINFEFEKLESAEGVGTAQAATVTWHTYWHDIKSFDVSVQKGLSNLFSSGRAQKEKLENTKKMKAEEAHEAFKKYYERGEPRTVASTPT